MRPASSTRLRSIHLTIAFWCCLLMAQSLAQPVNVRDFGALGDGSADDTEAIREALATSSQVHFPAGVYVLSDGIELPESAILTGDGSPVLGTFPITDDDKRFLTAEKLSQMPGTTLLFCGKGTASQSTGRKDDFADLRYAIKTAAGLPYQLADLAIVLDMRFQDGKGKRTTPENDQRADYDVGLLVDDSPGGKLQGFSIFGYWKRAGLCVVSRGKGSNPDYNTFWNCSFSGEYGVALLGSDTPDGLGLSGTQFYGCNLFSNDHHSRSAGQWGSGALYIDGGTDGKHADINGHYFFGGCVRTYNNVSVRLNRASNISFHSVVFEVPGYDGKNHAGADQTGRVVGTEHTRDVHFFGCRMHDIGLEDLAETMADGAVTVVGGMRQGISIQAGKNAVNLRTSPDGDPMIQLSQDPRSINNGWTLRLDTSDEANLVLRHDNRSVAKLTPEGQLQLREVDARTMGYGPATRAVIQDQRVAIEASRLRLFSASETTLQTLTGGTEGQIALLQLAEGSAPVLLLAEGGNLALASDCRLEEANQLLTLMRSGEQWLEISRSGN